MGEKGKACQSHVCTARPTTLHTGHIMSLENQQEIIWNNTMKKGLIDTGLTKTTTMRGS